MALGNLVELTGGLAFLALVQSLKGVRGIPLRIDNRYLKKARGTLTSHCQCPAMPTGAGDHVVVVKVQVRDAKGELCTEGDIHFSVRVK